MWSSHYAVWAGMEGRRELALRGLEKGIGERVVEPYRQFIECGPGRGAPELQRHTCFLTAPGGLLTVCVLGLPGLDLLAGEPADWTRRAICLPEGWEAIEVERVWAHGRPARLVARHGADQAELTLQ